MWLRGTVAAKLRTTINDPRIADSGVDELEHTLMFINWEEDSWFYRWERVLGLAWTQDDLISLTDESEAESSGNNKEKSTPSILRYPLSILVRPELLKMLKEQAASAVATSGMMKIPKGTLSMASLSKEEYLRMMGAAPADADELSGREHGPVFDGVSDMPSSPGFTSRSSAFGSGGR